jgi:hypothetical protein
MPRRGRSGLGITQIMAVIALGLCIVALAGINGPWLILAVMVLALAFLMS